VKFSKETGDICSFYDKAADQYIIENACSAILLDETDVDTWAHDKMYLGNPAGEFGQPEFSLIEEGPVRTTLRVKTYYSQSVLQRDYTLIPGNPVLTIKTKVDFHERHRSLKFSFPIQAENVLAKIPFGTIKRGLETGEEPCGSWIASGHLGVANDSKYGYDTTADSMRLTVLRSAVWADHYGVRDEFCEYMEQGVHEFSYCVFPYKNNLDAERRAEELNMNLRAVKDSFHKGHLPEQYSGYMCENDNVIVTAIKQSEDDEEPIIRICEMNGKDDQVKLELFGQYIETEIGHHEIKTFRTDGTELNLIEWI